MELHDLCDLLVRELPRASLHADDVPRQPQRVVRRLQGAVRALKLDELRRVQGEKLADDRRDVGGGDRVEEPCERRGGGATRFRSTGAWAAVLGDEGLQCGGFWFVYFLLALRGGVAVRAP